MCGAKLSYAIVTAIMLTCGMSPALSESDPILVGFAVSSTGFAGPFDGPGTRAAILKIEELNAAGGLLGRKIDYVVRDTKSSVADAANVGRELADRRVDLMVVSGTYDLAAPSAVAAQSRGILSFSLSAADPKQGSSGIGLLAFTAAGAAQSDGILIAEYAYKKGYKSVYILNDISLEYTKSTCAGFKAGWKNTAPDLPLSGEGSFKNRDLSIAAQISAIRSSKADFIFMCSFPPGGASAIRQIRAAGIDLPIASGFAMSPEFWLGSVPNLSNFYSTAHMVLHGDDPRPEVNAFETAYKTRYGEDLTMPYAIMGYSLIQAWASAVHAAGSTQAAAVAAKLKTMRDVPLAAGPYTFTDELQIQLAQPRIILRIDNGKQTYLSIEKNQWIPPRDLLFRTGPYAD